MSDGPPPDGADRPTEDPAGGAPTPPIAPPNPPNPPNAAPPPPSAPPPPAYVAPGAPQAAGTGGYDISDGVPRRLHPSSPVLNLIVQARQFVLPMVVVAFGSGRAIVTGPLVLIALAALVGWRIVAWRRFTYRLDGDALRIEHGVFNKERREIPLSRIQQVDLRRRLRHRVLGVAVVRIDTAGGGSGAEVTLEAIADDEANKLRQTLLRLGSTARGSATAGEPGAPGTEGSDGDAAEPQGPIPGQLVTKLSTRELALAGVTGPRLAVALTVAASAFALLMELPDSVGESVVDRISAGAAYLVVIAALAIPVWLAVAAGSSVLTDHDFTLVRYGDDLHLRRGLLDQREATISLRRIQAVRVMANPLRRPFSFVSVQLQSAGSGTAAEGEVSRLTVPYLRSRDLDAFLDHVVPGASAMPDLVPAPKAALRRTWVRRGGPVAIVAAIACVPLGVAPLAAVFVLALLPITGVAVLAYRGLGHATTATHVAARRGGLYQETIYVPIAKMQSTRLHSSPLQRRVRLATLHFDVAGRGRAPAVIDGDHDRLDRLRHTSLDARAARADEADVRRRTRADHTDTPDVLTDALAGSSPA